MTPGQRRALWICVFGMVFIFFYEARGIPLIREDAVPQGLKGDLLREHFWNQIGYGSAFLFLGTCISILVKTKPAKEGQAAFHALDWAFLAAGLGALGGILWQSYHLISV